MRNLMTVATFSVGIFKNKNIRIFLEAKSITLLPKTSKGVGMVVGWGKKPNTEAAIKFSNKFEVPYFALEDGFIHSMGQGVLGSESCSLVVDGKGIYYDATRSSDLEKLIINAEKTLLNQKKQVRTLIKRITQSNISKYNNGSLVLCDEFIGSKKVVLIIDQTAGDMSLSYGCATEKTFQRMVSTALIENTNATIILKVHPDVIVGKKKGNIDIESIDPRILILSEPINSIVLLKKVDVVYVATSQMGFEALMLGKRVVCFGVPFYSGWGLTDDRYDKELPVWGRRKYKRSLEEVFLAAYIEYTRYIHPDTKQLCTLEDVISYFELQFINKSLSSASIFCINFTRWKKSYIRSFLGFTDDLVFVASSSQAIKQGFNSKSQLVTWASKDQVEVAQLIEQFGVIPWQIEDGFIRSIGLGTDLTAPASLVLDKTGIYYDPTQVSDLETLLQTKVFSTEELDRAETLKRLLLKNELSKYNLGGSFSKSSLNTSKNQKIILIPGQVEGDASILKGCIDIDTNTALIKAVRENEPDAYLIYKPHPDVVSGNRKGIVELEITEKYADLVLFDASITDCLAVVDEVHTMTSLVGFEGLMRQLKVVCYGLPFYSNWGLTVDRHPLTRRKRKLELNELVFATLIDYPLYINWQTGNFTTPEVIVDQLKQQIDKQGGKQSNQVSGFVRKRRKVLNFIKGTFVS